ncbi:hypothetical protein GUITHDRAFT_103674 [Guillardia theta CCMP2712]|uniref:Uncharacterized protein n=1 Tax=Guillardia theta (strain CCMP2712) TaxID=905079 RepID=L1JQH9_GUITC|nr:hypothetical protein GUITHDRAFT_103674 [Guillardia theta CCMP2712]EKX50440.1 hypothetical protein GUITHDRAFT_103674 [Guillardia theta CCMP2712]|eukprot:XP_005837420.1 hypothetical protein GUITHDRAFT_103674 [Guillardia theta CCMP2712]
MEIYCLRMYIKNMVWKHDYENTVQNIRTPERACGMQGLAGGGGETWDLGLPQPLPQHRSPHEDDSTGGSEASLPR